MSAPKALSPSATFLGLVTLVTSAILTTYNPTDLRGLLHGGLPQVGFADVEKGLEAVRRMAALNERLALVEMTKHEFLDARRRKERTTFADGTTVTVDWDANTATITP